MANIKGIIVEIGGDTSGLQNALKKVNSNTASLSKELKGINSLLKLDPKNTELLSQKQTVLKQNIEQTSKKLEELRKAQEMADDTIASGGKISEENYRNLQREIINTENKLKNLQVEASKWTTAGRSIEEFGNKVTNISNKIDRMGTTLTTRLTLPIAAIATGLVSSAKEFETAFTGVEKTVDGTATQMANLKQGIKDMSEEIPSSTTEIAAVAEAAGQLGIATDDVLSFTKVMIDLGNSTNLSAEEAASALAKFANVTKMSANDYDKLGSTIVALGNNFATTEADIVSMATNLASTGELAGLSQPQILALATAMSSVGIEAEAGGSAMSKLLKKIQVACETGGKDLTNFSKIAGMSTSEFKKAFEQDAVGALSSFISGLNNTERNGKSAISILNDMGLTEVRLSNTVLSLANASDIMSGAVEMAGEAWEENTALTNEADKRYQTLDSRLEMTKNKIKNVATNTGDKLTPTFNKLLDKVDGLIDKFGDLNEEEITNIIKTAGLVAAIGPAIKILGTLGKTVGVVTKGVGTFSQAIAVAKSNTISEVTSINNIAKALTLASNPLGLFTAATIAAGVAVYAYDQKIMSSAKAAKVEKEEIEKQIDAKKKLQEEQNKQVSANITEIDNSRRLWNELKLITDENGKIKEGYIDRAQFITSELSKALGIEIGLNGDIIEGYQGIQSEIDKTILKKKAEIYLQKEEENYNTALSEREEAYKKLTELQSQLNEVQKTASKGYTNNFWENWKIDAAKQQVNQLSAALSEQQKLLDGYNQDISNYEYDYQLMTTNTADSLQELVNRNKANLSRDTINLQTELQNQIGLLSNKINSDKEMYNQAVKNKDESNKQSAINQLNSDKEELKQLGEKLTSMTSTIEAMTPEQVEMWRLLAQADRDIFSQIVSNMPEDMRKKLVEITGVTATNTEVPEALKLLGQQASDSFDTEISAMSGTTSNAIINAKKVIETDNSLQLASQKLGQDSNNKFKENINSENGKTAMTDYMQGAEDGVNKKKTSFWDLLFGVGKKGNQSMRDGLGDGSPSVLAKEALIDYFLGADIGIKKQAPKTLDKIEEYGTKINEEFIKSVGSLQVQDFGKLQGSLSSQIVDSTKTIFTTPRINFNVQELDEAKLQQCFNYINKKFGSAY